MFRNLSAFYFYGYKENSVLLWDRDKSNADNNFEDDN